jgi:hypothetical protein
LLCQRLLLFNQWTHLTELAESKWLNKLACLLSGLHRSLHKPLKSNPNTCCRV